MSKKTDYVLSYLTRSLLFVSIYQVIAIFICRWKSSNYLSIPTLFKIEFILYTILNIWFLGFASISDIESEKGFCNLVS